MIKTLTSTLAAIAMSASFAWADSADNKQLVLDMMQNIFAARDATAVDTYFTQGYIQHNPMLPSGSAVIKKFLSRPMDPSKPAPKPTQLHRIIGEGDLVATHSTYFTFGPKPMVAFDVFRIEDGKIAEHWDNLTPLREGANAAGRTQVDGVTEVSDLDQTEANKAVVLDLLTRMFIGGEKLDITQYISPVQYHQHNPDTGDGLAGLQSLMKANAAKGIKMRYEEIGLVVAEGNFVLTGASGQLGGAPTAFYDLFRLEDGLIVEHWDVIAPIQIDNLPKGYPGKF